MKIQKNQIDELDLQLTLEIAKEDYAEAEKKFLSQRRRTAEFKGFRKGNAPMAMIQRAYGEQALVEAVNKLISEGLTNFIKENNLHVLGEPLTSEDQPQIEWKSGNDFTFKFDLGTSKVLDFEVNASDNVNYYNISVSEDAKKEMKENMLRQMGSLQEGETAGEEDFVIADLSNEGHTVDGAYIAVRNVAGDAHSLFLGTKAGNEFDVDVNAAFADETDRASMLKVKKEELASLDPNFHVKVVNVKTYVAAEENQETYDKLFGEDKVHNSEEFDMAVTERLVDNYRQESDYRLSKDLREYLVKKADIALPEQFLKRWLFQINEGKFTMEQIDKEFDSFLADFRWQMVREYLMDKNSIKVEEKDLNEAAQAYVAYQYAMYGMGNVPEDLIRSAAQQVLSDEKQSRQIVENVETQKVISTVKGQVSLSSKDISVEEFRQL